MTRGDIYMLDFGIPFGSEPGRRRPVVIIQADKENLNNLNTKVVVPLTSNTINADLRGNVFLPKNESGLSKDSVALIHQIVVVDKFRLEEKISKLPKHLLSKIEDEIDYVTKVRSRHAVKPRAVQPVVLWTFRAGRKEDNQKLFL